MCPVRSVTHVSGRSAPFSLAVRELRVVLEIDLKNPDSLSSLTTWVQILALGFFDNSAPTRFGTIPILGIWTSRGADSARCRWCSDAGSRCTKGTLTGLPFKRRLPSTFPDLRRLADDTNLGPLSPKAQVCLIEQDPRLWPRMACARSGGVGTSPSSLSQQRKP